jgi:hypothetical protein
MNGKPRLYAPDHLEDPRVMLGLLQKVGLGPASAPSGETRLAAGHSLAAVMMGRPFAEAKINDALRKFDITSVDRIAVKLAFVRHGLLGR